MRVTFVAFLLAVGCVIPAGVHAEQSAQRVRVQSFRFTGNQVIDAEALARVVQPYQGKECTLAELKSIADRVAAYYHGKGYFLAKVVLPEQDVSNGVVTFQVFEGKLGRLTFSGNKRYSDSRLQDYFARTTEQGVLMQSPLERSLLLLNDLPGLKATSVLQAGQAPGTTDLTIRLEESSLITGVVDMDNFGSRFSRVRMSVGTDIATQRGDQFSLRVLSGTPPKALYYGNFGYSGPIGHSGTRIGLYALHGNFGVGKEFSILNIEGRATALGLQISHPLVKTRRDTITVMAGLDSRDSRQSIISNKSSLDLIRVAQIGVSRTTENLTGRTFTSLSIQQGLGELLGGMSAGDPWSSRYGAGAVRADNRFTKVLADAGRVEFFNRRTSLVARASGQWCARSLVVGEQMAIGGPDSVRGYPQAEARGDSGIQASLETRIAVNPEKPEKLQGVVFVDWGMTTMKKAVPGEQRTSHLLGAGIGLRAMPVKGLSVRADVGFPLFRQHLSSGGRRPSSGGTIVPYLQVSSRF